MTETGFEGVGKREAWRLIGIFREITEIPACAWDSKEHEAEVFMSPLNV